MCGGERIFNESQGRFAESAGLIFVVVVVVVVADVAMECHCKSWFMP